MLLHLSEKIKFIRYNHYNHYKLTFQRSPNSRRRRVAPLNAPSPSAHFSKILRFAPPIRAIWQILPVAPIFLKETFVRGR